MKAAKKLFSSLKWIFFVSRRFSRVDRSGRGAITSVLSSLGVAFGVMALIVVISVMNGFQLEFIDAIMEISSYHVRVFDGVSEDALTEWCSAEKMVRSVTPFYEAQGLMVSSTGREGAALVRAVEPSMMETDAGIKKEMRMIYGSFDLSAESSIVLGYDLARSIGARVGSTVNIFALSGSSETAMFSQDREFVVTGIFYSHYSDINQAYSFINIAAGEKYFGKSSRKVFGIKIKDRARDALLISRLRSDFPDINAESWRGYNRAFFGALRIEKNMLMLLVFLIFLVVAVNIYNAMRRMVYERREEIAVFTALGSSAREVQLVFIAKGFLTGFIGALPGLCLGLLLCVNIRSVFMLLSKGQYYLFYFFAMLINPSSAAFLQENPMFGIYAAIPARMIFGEILAIFFFGIFSALGAAWVASREILKLTVAEVLHDD